MHCFTGFSELTMFHTHICKLYENPKHLLQKDSWSTFTPTQFVNLLFIHHLKKLSTQKQLNIVANIMRESISSSMLQSYTTSNVEDIFEKTDGDNSEGKIVLIEGAPGIGKTILCKEIAYRWACKKLLHNDNLLMLVFLRDPNIQCINSIEALVQYMYRSKSDKKVIKISRSCATHLIETEGANTTIILDGFDELSHLKGENDFILELLYKNILPLCRIVVSSRPIASKDLQKLADVKVEILGFSEESRHMFINNELKENHDRLYMLKSYLKENRIINCLCYIPFMLSLLVCIAKECEELPKSQTELYTKFIVYCISRFLQRLNPPGCAIANLNDLPLNFKIYFLEICKYAYSALERDIIVFTANEIKTDFPMFANAPGGWSGLGLLKSAEYFSAEENSNCTSYNFLHLSIQEYLAAYHINGLETNQQIRILKKCFFVDKYLNMWIMYCGMSERSLALEHFLSDRMLKVFTRWFSIHQISKDIMQCKIRRFYLFQCLSEIKNHRVHDLVSTLFQKGILDLSGYTLMAKDINTLIYILNRLSTTHWDELNLSKCNIGDAGCNQLCKNLNDTNFNITFDKLNLSNNQLTIDSIEVVIDIVVRCDTKMLYLSDNFNINSDTKLAYLAMEYAFKDKLQKHPLTIQIFDEKNVVFSKLDEQVIITHLKTMKFIKGTYFINCKIDDEMVATITERITTNKLIQVCLWNSSTSSNVVQQILSSMLEEVESQLLFVYEDSYSVHLDSVLLTFITAEYVHFTFIFFNTFTLMLHSINDMHAKFMILSNPLFYFKPEELTEIQISNCNISEDIISLLSQLISQCKVISKYLLLNNVFNIKLLQKLIDAVNPLPSLGEVIIEHNRMTTNDCCSIVNMLSSNHLHAVLIFYHSILGVYRCHDKQLNDSVAIISAVKQLYEKEERIIVYEKNLISDAKHIHNACKLPVTYVLLNRTTLMVKNAKDFQVIFTVINSSFQPSSISEIVFSNCPLHDRSIWIKTITQTIMLCKILTKITFLNNNLDSSVIKILIKSLRALPLIKEIMIYEISLSCVEIADIYTILNDFYDEKSTAVIIMSSEQILGYKCNSNLFNDAVNINYGVSSVNLVFCTINQCTFQSMGKILCIKNIELFNCAIDMQGIIGHIQLSDSTISTDTELNETTDQLQVYGNQFRNEELISSIASVISKNKALKNLRLSNSNLKNDGVMKLTQSLCNHNKLKCINLQSNNITKEAAEAIASVISNNPGLEELYLDNNQLHLGVIKIATALENISSLKVLGLQNNNISDEAASALAAAIKANNSLEKLWLSGNHLGSSVVAVVNALKELSTLKQVHINDTKIRGKELVPALTSVLIQNTLIDTLSVSDNNLNDDCIIKIAQPLHKHSKLRFFNLRNNNITEEAAEALVSVISSNTGLQKLYFGNNHLHLGVIKIVIALENVSSLKVLDLQNNNITKEVVDKLSGVIAANNSVEKLWLNNNYLESSISVIAKACCHGSCLKELYISNTGISKESANELFAVVVNCISLLVLSLSDNNLQSSGFMIIAQALILMSSLKRLHANSINISSSVSTELSAIIDQNLLIQEISLRDNLLENGLIQIAESCSRLMNLKVLELAHNQTSPMQVVNLASAVNKCSSLELLSLGGICMSINESIYLNVFRIYNKAFYNGMHRSSNVPTEGKLFSNVFQMCSEILRTKMCQALILNYDSLLNVIYLYCNVYISFQHRDKFNQTIENSTNNELIVQETKENLSQINSKVMVSSLKIIKRLKVVNLEDNNIDEDAAIQLADHLHYNNVLKQLWLRGNELYDNGASVVLQSLCNLSTLLILDLSFNHLSSESADDIAVVIGNNCSLQQLWLDGNDLLTRGIVIIASALKKLSSLRILSLCSNGITDNAAEEISIVITNNVLLVDVLLGNNQLQATGVCKIAVALRKLVKLRKLDLFNSQITSDAAEELAVTLSNCTNLQQLFLSDNMLGNEGTIKIADALKCINSLQVLTFSNNNITESAAGKLVDIMKNNISLKIILIGGNDLQTTGINLIVQTAKNISTLQLLDVSDNNVSEEKENFKTIFPNGSNFTIVV